MVIVPYGLHNTKLWYGIYKGRRRRRWWLVSATQLGATKAGMVVQKEPRAPNFVLSRAAL